MSFVTFGIPLLSRRIARDWPSAQRLLANTLRSVFNQSADVRVIVACHEAPDIDEARDPRVQIVQVDFDIPRFQWEQEIDRMRKLEVIAAAHRAQGAGWLFILDADDLVSRTLAERILKAQTKAVCVRNGYRLDVRRGMVQPLSRFWRKCGSCVAVNWTAEELPVKPLSDNPPVFHQFAETRHYLLPEFFAARGWSMSYEDLAAAYLVNHGQNQSDIIVRDNLKWRLYFLLTRWKPWTAALDAEFGADAGSRSGAIYTGDAKFGTEA